jgi:hypothetical protein
VFDCAGEADSHSVAAGILYDATRELELVVRAFVVITGAEARANEVVTPPLHAVGCSAVVIFDARTAKSIESVAAVRIYLVGNVGFARDGVEDTGVEHTDIGHVALTLPVTSGLVAVLEPLSPVWALAIAGETIARTGTLGRRTVRARRQ